ncbi:MAG: hypothetical protein HYY34_02070 [Chloroflexi bacterium]|nr:hypothetical protein [Chloroflexota bacterium]
MLLVAAVVGLSTRAQATHGPTHTDGKVYLTNEWSKLTTESSPPSARTYVGAGKTLYFAFDEVASTATSTVTNTIETDSNKIRITVVDADKNVSVATTTSVTFPSSTTTAGTARSFALPLTAPIVDRDGDGTVTNDAGDVTISALSSGTAFVSGVLESDGSTNGGVVSVTALTDIAASATMTIGWNTSQIDTITTGVTHISSQGTTAITIPLTETGRSTGRFEAVLTLFDVDTGTASATTTRGIASGGILTVEYTDGTPVTGTSLKSSATAVAETTAPSISVTGPTNKLETKERQPLFSGSVSDSTSGLRISRQFVFIDDDDDASNAAAVDTATTGNSDLSVTPTLTSGTVDGAVSTSWTFTPGSTQLLPSPTITEANHIVDWQYRATDLAGNVSFLDSDSSTAGIQNYTVKIDQVRPGILDSFTGHAWDTTLATPALKENVATSIEVLFNDNLDSSSIQNTDFEVVIDSTTFVPDKADVFSGAKDSVFLTMAAALKADAKPTVKIKNQVADIAGNIENTGSKVAIDSLGPTLTATLAGGSSTAKPTSLTNDKITVTITSDESLSGDPVLQVYTATGVTEGAAVTAINKGGNTWEVVLTKSGRVDGKKSIVVTATDQATATTRKTVAVAPNTATKGKQDPADTAAITYTLDTTLPALTTTPADASTTDELRPFVILDWGEAIATINKATFNGTDITASLSASSDRKKWIYKPAADLTLAKHTVVAQATDDAGNKGAELTKTFTVAARAAFSLPLNPGWNLVSLRSEPADTSINSVITVKDISTVITYDPGAIGGPWLVATRGADGKLAGSLATIDAMHGYWINTTSFEPIKVLDPKPQGGSLPPAIPVSAGWNLVPARDITGTLTAGTVIPSDRVVTTGCCSTAYFNGTKIQRAYKFDTLAGVFIQLTLTGGTPTDIKVGEAYWAYFTEAGAVVP